jgi:integrase
MHSPDSVALIDEIQPTASLIAFPKAIEATQRALDDLPLNGGTYRVLGIPGLYVRARAETKSFYVQRRIRGVLTKKTLGAIPMKAAKDRATQAWGSMKARPAAGGVMTLGSAFEMYLADSTLADSTRKLYDYLFLRHLGSWRDLSIAAIGEDRPGVRALQRFVRANVVRTKSSPSQANSAMKLLGAVYTWSRKEDPKLPESPMTAIKLDQLKPRDWAYTPEQLREWYAGVQKLNPVKRTWWLTILFTGARRGSVEPLKWADFNFDKKTLHFRIAKGNRPYSVPVSEVLTKVITDYRDSGDAPPSEWLFPSPIVPGQHMKDIEAISKALGGPHHLRHTFKTVATQLGFSEIQSKILQNHSFGSEVSRGYIQVSHLLESLRPVANAVAQHYAEIFDIGVR